MGGEHDATKNVARGRRGQGAPSIATVARRAGVSAATVSRVVNGVPNKVSKETLARVREAIAALNYRPMRAGITLRTKQTRLVALLIPDLANSFYAAVAAAVEQTLAAENLTMIVGNTAENATIQDDYLREMRAHMVRGIALFGAVESPILTEFVESGEPVLFVNRPPPGGLAGPFVGIDNAAAGRDVARHIAACGRAHPAVIHGPLSSPASADRLNGFLESMADIGRPLTSDRLHQADLSMIGGYGGAAALLDLDPRPTAIFCGNDQIAYGVYRRCREHGLSVPGDVALFGFDDNPMNQWIAPWLSTVRVPYDAFGPAVRDLFNSIWSGGHAGPPRQIILPHELILRQPSS